MPYMLRVLCPVVDSACNRNEYQGYLPCGKGGRCVGLTILPLSCTDCLEILEISTSWGPKGLSRPVQRLLYPFFRVLSMYIDGLASQQISLSSLVVAIRPKFKYISGSANVMLVSVSPQTFVCCPWWHYRSRQIKKVQHWGGNWWYDTHTRFHKKSLSCFKCGDFSV